MPTHVISGNQTQADPVTGNITGISPVEVTYAEIVSLITSSGLNTGSVYKITDRGDRGLFFVAVSNNLLSREGTRIMLCPARYSTSETDASGNVWKGVWNSTKDPSVNDLMIWGGKVWKNLSGSIGTATNDLTLDGTNWQLISKSSFTNSEYVALTFGVSYDVQNDWIERQWDSVGNSLGLDYQTQLWWYGDTSFNSIDASDWNFGSNAEGRIMFNNVGWGIWNNSNAGNIYGNKVVVGIYKNSHNGDIVNNVCDEISGNYGAITSISSNQCYIISDNHSGGTISYNVIPSAISSNSCGGAIQNNTNKGGIASNTNSGVIQSNSNNGNIQENSNGDIFNNCNNGGIEQNSNSQNISQNQNNGPIQSNSGTGSIKNNINNGYIAGLVLAGDITDTASNKG
jgi:hypothetical protein